MENTRRPNAAVLDRDLSAASCGIRVPAQGRLGKRDGLQAGADVTVDL